jgi:hypothetical protein
LVIHELLISVSNFLEILWSLTLPSFYGGNFTCKTMKFLQLLGPYLRKQLTKQPHQNISLTIILQRLFLQLFLKKFSKIFLQFTKEKRIVQ